MTDVPEGMDTAIFRQGEEDGLREVATGVVKTNPFAEGTHQADSWAAGYAAGKPADPPVSRGTKSKTFDRDDD
jgi:hypothetical protein